MVYKIYGACKSVIGNVRENNEDNYYFDFKRLKEENNGDNKTNSMKFESIDNIVCSVFDGMGGESNGQRASYLASAILDEYLKDNVNNTFSWKDYINLANKNICDEMTSNIRMGTTVAAIQFLKDNISICNLGDSKIFGYKNNYLKQLSFDHTDAKVQERLNIKTNKAHRLTQHLGIRENEMVISPYIDVFNYEVYSKILICSDGLTDMVSNNDIESILSSDCDIKAIVDMLIDKALENGGLDNITVMVFEIKEYKKDKINKYILITLIFILAIFLLIVSYMNKFKILKDDYNGALIVGDYYELKYRGNYTLKIDNDNIIYSNGKIKAISEGTSTITIVDKKGNVLYSKTIKVFPN